MAKKNLLDPSLPIGASIKRIYGIDDANQDAVYDDTALKNILGINGKIEGITAGDGVSVNNSVANTPAITVVDRLKTVVGGNNISIDATDTVNPIISFKGELNVVEVTASRDLTTNDIGKILVCTGTSDITITVPDGLLEGFNCILKNNTDSNRLDIVEGGSASVNNLYNEYSVLVNGTASLLPNLSTDSYTLSGETH